MTGLETKAVNAILAEKEQHTEASSSSSQKSIHNDNDNDNKQEEQEELSDELVWAINAGKYAESYFKLITTVPDTKTLKLTKYVTIYMYVKYHYYKSETILFVNNHPDSS